MLEESFETFSPEEYLKEYYSHMSKEEIDLLEFFIYAYSFLPKNSLILELGGGPTIYQLITASTYAREIYFAEYLDINLKEIKKWLSNAKDAFNWDLYFKKALQLEGSKSDSKNINKRKYLLRHKITRLIYCNVFNKDPLGENNKQVFDIVSVNFVPESISKNKIEWKNAIKNICSLIRPGGFLVMTALGSARYWHAGKKKFPAANIDENDIKAVLIELGFEKNMIKIKTNPAETIDDKGKGAQGFDGVICVLAKNSF